MGATLTKPITSKVLTRTGSPSLQISACEMNGKRKTMEDSICIQFGFSACSDSSTYSFFGIFDGHGGGQASHWISNNLHKNLALKPDLGLQNIVDSCLETDAAYLCYEEVENMAKRDEFKNLDQASIEDGAGTTSVFAIIEEGKNCELPMSYGFSYRVTVGNIGDSRAIIIRNNGNEEPTVEQITVDHKPTSWEEKKRIITAGSEVCYGRVGGNLALSRAFGDFRYKKNSFLPSDRQAVIAVPDVYTVANLKESDMILLFCDGLYEGGTSNKDIVSVLLKYIGETPDDPAVALGFMFDDLVKKSEDNMSCILIQFKDGSSYSKHNEQGEKEYIAMSADEKNKFTPEEAHIYSNFKVRCGIANTE